MTLNELLDLDLLKRMHAERYVAAQTHPTAPLAILNYTQRCQFDRAWNPVTQQCRGLIYNHETHEVVARPWPKFFNYGEYAEGTLDLEAPVTVTDKLDGSLGILYPTAEGWAIATRGSFLSEQAVHATEVWRERYADISIVPAFTYLFEIVYPGNRIVIDYGELDDLVLLGVLDTETGRPAEVSFAEAATYFATWTGPVAETYAHRTLAEALEVEPRPNCEGLVVYFPDTNERLKLKQEDYVALHRILTGTNARNVWEVAAVQTCAKLIREPKHWGSFLGIDPARALECAAVGDAWLEDVPDEFHDWVRDTIEKAHADVDRSYAEAVELVACARRIEDRKARFEAVKDSPFQKEVMRLASATTSEQAQNAVDELTLRCWREACPEPTAPFARSEAIA